MSIDILSIEGKETAGMTPPAGLANIAKSLAKEEQAFCQQYLADFYDTLIAGEPEAGRNAKSAKFRSVSLMQEKAEIIVQYIGDKSFEIDAQQSADIVDKDICKRLTEGTTEPKTMKKALDQGGVSKAEIAEASKGAANKEALLNAWVTQALKIESVRRITDSFKTPDENATQPKDSEEVAQIFVRSLLDNAIRVKGGIAQGRVAALLAGGYGLGADALNKTAYRASATEAVQIRDILGAKAAHNANLFKDANAQIYEYLNPAQKLQEVKAAKATAQQELAAAASSGNAAAQVEKQAVVNELELESQQLEHEIAQKRSFDTQLTAAASGAPATVSPATPTAPDNTAGGESAVERQKRKEELLKAQVERQNQRNKNIKRFTGTGLYERGLFPAWKAFRTTIRALLSAVQGGGFALTSMVQLGFKNPELDKILEDERLDMVSHYKKENDDRLQQERIAGHNPAHTEKLKSEIRRLFAKEKGEPYTEAEIDDIFAKNDDEGILAEINAARETNKESPLEFEKQVEAQGVGAAPLTPSSVTYTISPAAQNKFRAAGITPQNIEMFKQKYVMQNQGAGISAEQMSAKFSQKLEECAMNDATLKAMAAGLNKNPPEIGAMGV
jgi:hypothetical protein